MDVDGVLNYEKWWYSDKNPGNLHGKEGDIDPDCVKRILKICDATGALIVLSSDWRISWPGSLIRLDNAGFRGYIIDKTPSHMWRQFVSMDKDYEVSRGSEIDEWLQNHQDTWDYLIIDDRCDFSEEQKRLHFLHIDSMYGITDEDVEKGIEILSR